MRIISGIAKGKKILLPLDKKTRPLKDMVRESIFNIIDHANLLSKKLSKCYVLDLFSGIGSFGIEAISRGAKLVVFYEDYIPAVKLLDKNIQSLSFNNEAKIYKRNVYKKQSFAKLNYKFDIIFLDPPFRDKKIKDIIKNLINEEITSKNALFIIHRHKKTIDDFGPEFQIIKEKTYGSSKIIFGYISF